MRNPIGDGRMVEGNNNTTQPAPCIRSGRVDHTMVEEDVEPMRNPYTGRIGMTKKKITWKDDFPFSETENRSPTSTWIVGPISRS